MNRPVAPPVPDTVIDLVGVRYRYPTDAPADLRTAALDGVSFRVHAGERVCLVGANGSGKSTLLQMLNALIVPDEGTARVLGIDTTDPVGARTVRRRSAMVFQHPDDQMVTSIVADDVAFGPENLGVPQPEIARRVARALEAVDMAAYVQADPADLSGGQRQRVAIAGALAMEPQVLLLDEPAAMLDEHGRHAIQRILDELQARGITIVHVTHFMDDALAADRVVVLDRGRIVLDDTPDAVFANRARLEGLGLEPPFALTLADRLETALPGIGALPRTAQPAALADALAARLTPAHAHGGARPAGAHSDASVNSAGDGEVSDPALVFEDVSFSYALDTGKRRRRWKRAAARRELEGVSFHVPRGSLCALIGRTGAGKSTAVELACALKLPLAGRVLVNGIDTTDRARRRELRRAIGYVSQFPERQLFAETVFDDVAFGPRNLGLTEDEVRVRVEESLAALGLEPARALLERSPFELSGGQRRSVALAGVIAMRTPILVLDEPLSGLDPRGRARMRALIDRLRDKRTTILVVTHDMDDAATLVDQVVVLDRGHVAAAGSPRAVFARAAGCALPDYLPGAPQATAFAQLLTQRGVAIDSTPLDMDELVAELVHLDSTAHTADPVHLKGPASASPTAQEVPHGAPR